MQFGGFPEPHFKQSTRSLKRWQRERMQQVMQEDLRDLERVQELSLIELVVDRLPQLVGSPLSINALREDLNTSHQTVAKWLTILERLFVHFRIYPYGAPKIRAVKKEAKLYMWDWATVSELGFRFENLVASHLLKFCHFHEDTEGDTMELRYLRDTDSREVDFVVLKNKKPLFAVECKLQDTAISPALKYFAERTPIPQFFQVHMGTKDFLEAKHSIRVLPFVTFCREMGLV